MTDNNNNDNARMGASFLGGFLLGRRSRNRGGLSMLLILAGVVGIAMAFCTVVVGVPMSTQRASEVRSLPQISAEELDALDVGTTGLFLMRAAEDAPRGDKGLIAERVETRFINQNPSEYDTNSYPDDEWVFEPESLTSLSGVMDGSRIVIIELSPQTTMQRAEVITEGDDTEEQRYTGYPSNSFLTVEGTWMGSDTIVADALTTDTPDEYVQQANSAPFGLLIWGFVCGGIALVMLVAGGLMKLVGA